MSSQQENYQQFDRGYSATPPRQGSGCLRGCGIAGILLLILLAAIVAAGYWFYHQITKGMTDDPAEVLRRLHEEYPTAQVPKGYVGKAGFRLRLGFELDFLVFAKGDAAVNEEGGVDSGDAMILFHVKVPGEGQANFDLNQLGDRGRLIEKKPYPLRVGEYEFDASLQKIAPSGGAANETKTQIEVWLGPHTVLLMQGDGDKVDETALKSFLASIAKDCPAAKKTDGDPQAKGEGKPPAPTRAAGTSPKPSPELPPR